jgi:flagellar hook assembly protein FlgD
MNIYDATGRLVKQYNDPTIGLSNDIIWNGLDNAGNIVPSGVYFVRFELGENSVTKSIVLSK